MTLREALETIAANRHLSGDTERVYLACGFTPLHLKTFLAAHVQRRLPGRKIEAITGLFGDLPGNIQRASRERIATAVVIEWQDLDPRLGLRTSGGFVPSLLPDIAAEARTRLRNLADTIRTAASEAPVAVCGPTLPLPPVAHVHPSQASGTGLDLARIVTEFLAACASLSGVRVLNSQQVDQRSPALERFDMKSELYTGFPYKQRHAELLAGMMADVLYPPAPKKGLIVDLDNTLWSGIVGEIGIDNVCWDLERKAQVHGLLQQMLAALAETGVLLAIASKNDPAIVSDALRRSDLLIPSSSLFPIEVSWGAKSAAVDRILKVWNIGADSVVFIDDSPMELAEVQTAHPQIECLQFSAGDPQRVWELLWRLRELFGKPSIGEEDRLRTASLRTAAELQKAQGSGEAAAGFLESIAAKVTLDFRKDTRDQRAFELINKTNQFNLNGRRYTESEWRAFLDSPESFQATVSYEDKFGPLGKIGVVLGSRTGGDLKIHCWVMSCRAFSRRIEHHTLDRLFSRFGATQVMLDYQPTDRNMPLQEYLSSIADGSPVSQSFVLRAGDFLEKRGPLPHSVVEIDA
jgi:FkbH-like protein